MENKITNEVEKSLIDKQKEVCLKYGSEFLEATFDKFVGVAIESFDKFSLPVNGLRHPVESEQSTNWYIWAGEYSDADDYFKPVHIYHLLEICPKAIKYLGLAPGWRFLFDNNYEDVWYDPQLLNI